MQKEECTKELSKFISLVGGAHPPLDRNEAILISAILRVAKSVEEQTKLITKQYLLLDQINNKLKY